MNKLLPYFVLAIALFAVTSNSNVQANETEKKFINAGLIDVHVVDKSIKVDLVNSDPHKNFFQENYYGSLARAYLRKDVATKLSSAQKFLKIKFPGHSLLIMDAARPRSVSRMMYDKMKGTKFEKFVANPAKGSMHNYGIAVDITIVDENDKRIDMGFTPFYKNKFSIYWGYANLRFFGLSDVQKMNRKLLSDVMTKAGFIPLSYEWWHFNGMKKYEARKRYRIIE